MNISKATYEKLAQAFVDKGLTPEEAREACIKSGNKLKFEGETYTNVYYVRIMAIMHNIGSDEAFEL
jgi:hypothetical protein